ncbi:MAG: peptidoglycan DD-metalloendopeptidase family protein [Candidatus Sericytochromatia bacterium]|nr:peptidoglycan DD-metalloendopeptidase family protein [Candidatus Sericytochromatia bacterium]
MEIQPNMAAEDSGSTTSGRRNQQWQTVPQTLPEVTVAALSALDRRTPPDPKGAAPTAGSAAKPAGKPPAHAGTKPPARAGTTGAKPGAKPAVNPAAKPRPLVVTSSFGVRTDPFTGQAKTHKGVEFAAPIGTPIRASRSGKVTFAGEADGYGRLVIVDHGQGVETWYAHASAMLVKAGETVKAGQTIAKVGTVGRSTGPHLHFEIRRNGRAVDPWPLLDGGKSRAWYSPL